MVGGKGSGGEWKINEERMDDVEVFKYLGVWIDRGMRGNVHLEKMRKKAEKWGARIGYMSNVNREMEVDRASLEHASGCVVERMESCIQEHGKN